MSPAVFLGKTMRPSRIQLLRAHGWRMPPNAVKVDRTTKWGNPFDIREYGLELSLRLYEDTVRGVWSMANVAHVDEPTAEMLHEAHCRWHRRLAGNSVDVARAELRGKHLGCWCPLPMRGDPDNCHAAILLRLANE
jgi:hypothetical protein